jgi:hypothetical protein
MRAPLPPIDLLIPQAFGRRAREFSYIEKLLRPTDRWGMGGLLVDLIYLELVRQFNELEALVAQFSFEAGKTACR